MWLFFLFLCVPLIEIALFIQVGGWLGLWPTLGIVVATAAAGTYLVRSQGSQALQRLRQSFEELRDPTETLAHGAMILFSGALLLTPGFFTDAIGFLLLIPSVRSYLMRRLRDRVELHSMTSGSADWRPSHPIDGQIIEGEHEVRDRPSPDVPSGWTRH